MAPRERARREPVELEAWLRLLDAARVGPRGWLDLLKRHRGDAAAVAALPARELARAGIDEKSRTRFTHADAETLERAQLWLAGGRNRRLVTWGGPVYPPRLAVLDDAPLALWVEGDALELLDAPQLAIVGSRHPTRGGLETARAFARYLSERGLTITSGLAVGIDAAGHRGALAGPGSTIAVLGSGLDRIYPSEHVALAREIVAKGLLISEHAPGTPPLARNFPHRNRIIAALALGTLVVEATRRSGSLITARLAAECGREVFAIPGSIHNPLARGCHWLLRQGATLIEDANEILRELAPTLAAENSSPDVATDASAPASIAGEPGYAALLDALGFDPVEVNELALRAGLTAAELSSMLLVLELEGFVEALPGGRYSRVARRSR